MSVSVTHPTGHSNFTEVTMADLTLWFSYQTIIAWRISGGELHVSENVWSQTTGKHLNHISTKDQREDNEKFSRDLVALLARRGLA